MRTRLPIVKCLEIDTSDTRIIDLDIEGSDKYFIYEVPIDIDLNKVLRNDVSYIRIQAISTTKTTSTTTLHTVNSDVGKSKMGNVMYGTAMTLDDIDSTVVGSATANGNVSKDTVQEDAYTGFIDLSNSDSSNSKSKTQEIADAYSKIKWESTQQFSRDKRQKIANVIDTDERSIESALDSQLKELVRRSSARSYGGAGLQQAQRLLPTSGLTGQVRSKQTFQKIKGVLSNNFEIVGLPVHVVEGMTNTAAGQLANPVTVKVEGIEELNRKKYGNVSEYESEPRGSGRRPRRVRATRAKRPSDGLKEYQSDLEAQLERSSKENLGSTARSFRSAVWKAYSDMGKSPAQLMMEDTSDFFISARSNFQGTTTGNREARHDHGLATKSEKRLPGSKNISKENKTREENAIADVLRSGIKMMPLKRQDRVSRRSGDVVGVVVRKPADKVTVKCELEIDDSRVIARTSFIVRVQALNSKRQIVDSSQFSVPHEKLKKDFQSTSVPPELAVSIDESGSVSITVKQIDRDADRVTVYKKEISQKSIIEGRSFEKIMSFKLTDEDSSRSFDDKIKKSNGAITLYRAVSLSKHGGSGAFTDFVLDNRVKFRKSLGRSRLSEDAHMAVITNTIKTGKIILKIRKIFVDAGDMYIEKRCVTAHEKEYKRIEIPREIDPERGSVLSKDELVDENVTVGLIYEYRTVVVTKDGRTIPSETTHVIECAVGNTTVKVTNHPIIASVEARGRNQVSMDLGLTPASTNDDAKYLNAFLSDEKIKSMYEEEISSIKDDVRTVTGMSVTRTDLLTGEVVSLGVKAPGKFIDMGSARKGIPSPQGGREYQYEIEVLERDARGFIEDIAKTKKDVALENFRMGLGPMPVDGKSDIGKETDQNYVAKFKSPTVVKTGTISSGQALLKNRPENLLELGKTGRKYKKTVFIPYRPTRITSGEAKLTKNGQVALKWRVRAGNRKNDVDFYVVTATRMNITYVALTCHGSALRGGEFIIVDPSQNDFIGTVTYSVIPVYNNYEKGEMYLLGRVVVK